MSVSRALDRERRLLAGVCCHAGCAELATVGRYCAPHDAHERGQTRARVARLRLRRAQGGLCRDCGEPSARFRCASCREVYRAAIAVRRRSVTGAVRSVTLAPQFDGLVSAIRPGRDRSLLVTLELPIALLLSITDAGDRVAPCGHRLCSRDDGRSFCVFAAIRSARHMRQLDGSLPDERGARNGVEYALTVEQIAQLVGVSTRSVEQSLKAALDKLRDQPNVARLIESLIGG